MTLKDKAAIVTGGSRGIGKAIALKLASLGADIALIYHGSSDKAAECIKEIESLGVKACAYRCDVSSFEETKQTVAEIRKEFPSVEILVNNAGITDDTLIAMMSEEFVIDLSNCTKAVSGSSESTAIRRPAAMSTSRVSQRLMRP